MATGERLLIRTGALMAALALVFGAAMLLDARTIEGAAAWLKPAKFAVSTSIYSFTLAWFSRYLTSWPRTRIAAAWTTSSVFVIEVGLIALQAARGTTSHFNTSTGFDGLVFGVMGISIFLQTAAAGFVAAALWRQPLTDRALGWALRLGMTIAVLGALTGGLMTRPTNEQLATVRETHVMPRSGAHTVGAEDGGPGLPGTGWSVDHGDLRVPHFLGLHAMQALPLIIVFVGRRWNERARVALVIGAAALYMSLFVILVAQALMGQSLVAPAGAVLGALSFWLVAAVLFTFWIQREARRKQAAAGRGWSIA